MAKKDRNYLLFVEDVLVNLEHAVEYTQGMNLDSFLNDRKTQDAVIRCIEIAGEAAHNVPDVIKEKYPDVDWDDLYAFRVKMAHHYFDTDVTIVWQIVQQHISRNIELLKIILEKETNA